MGIDNLCEFIRKIHANPMAKITDLTIRDFNNLQNHLQSCSNCAILTDEILEKYKDVPTNSEWERTKYN